MINVFRMFYRGLSGSKMVLFYFLSYCFIYVGYSAVINYTIYSYNLEELVGFINVVFFFVFASLVLLYSMFNHKSFSFKSSIIDVNTFFCYFLIGLVLSSMMEISNGKVTLYTDKIIESKIVLIIFLVFLIKLSKIIFTDNNYIQNSNMTTVYMNRGLTEKGIKKTFYHEFGHALIMLLFEQDKISHIFVKQKYSKEEDDTKDYLGQVVSKPNINFKNDFSYYIYRSLVFYAGKVGELIYKDRQYSSFGHNSDFEYAQDYIIEMLSSNYLNLPYYAYPINYYEEKINKKTEEEVKNRLIQVALNLVNEHKEWIENNYDIHKGRKNIFNSEILSLNKKLDEQYLLDIFKDIYTDIAKKDLL